MQRPQENSVLKVETWTCLLKHLPVIFQKYFYSALKRILYIGRGDINIFLKHNEPS